MRQTCSPCFGKRIITLVLYTIYHHYLLPSTRRYNWNLRYNRKHYRVKNIVLQLSRKHSVCNIL